MVSEADEAQDRMSVQSCWKAGSEALWGALRVMYQRIVMGCWEEDIVREGCVQLVVFFFRGIGGGGRERDK